MVLETKVMKNSPQKKKKRNHVVFCFPSHKKTVFEIKFSFLVFQKAGCFWKQIDDLFLEIVQQRSLHLFFWTMRTENKR